MVTASGPAGRKTSANPHVSAAAPITTASESRTAERPGRIRNACQQGQPTYLEGGTSIAIAWLTQSAKRLRRRRLCPLPRRRRCLSSCVPNRTKYGNRPTRGHPMPAALRLALVALLVATRITTAQETATEQVAAADVIRRMSELERSLALPQLVARLAGARDARRDAVIARAKDLMDRELLATADDITRHPETGWKEERSVKILTDYLTAHGFDVEPGVAGLKTAFVARYRKGTPGPNLGV